MTQVTLRVSASPFAVNMAVRQNAIDHSSEFLLAVEVVFNSFYMDDSLTSAGSKDEVITLQTQLQDLFTKEDFY